MADRVTIPDSEFAVKLTSDIRGGIGNHEKGTVLRNLSQSAFNTLVCGGFAKRVRSTASGDIVDYDAPNPAPASAPKPG